MKEQEIIKAVKKMDNIAGQMNAVIGQMNNLKDLTIGTLETLKRMPGYDKALEKLKKDMSEEAKLEK
jgi:hypothetical protein|tara:strand:- start:866 stop:1066 length:201 start_codon:yes stop_codon:yes gene_type:complete